MLQEKVLREKDANLLHPNLQFTIGKPNTNGKLAFLDLQTSIDKRKINCGWYQKPTDTVTILNFRSCSPIQYKRSVIEGTAHRVFRSTSTWEEYDKAMKSTVNSDWITNIRKVGRRGLRLKPLKRSSGRAKTKRTWLRKKKPCYYNSDSPPILMVQYRVNHTQTLAKKVRDITNAQIIFTTRKMKTCTPTLKSSLSTELKSKWCTDLNVVGANPSMLTRRSDISPQ